MKQAIWICMVALALTAASCARQEPAAPAEPAAAIFDPASLRVPDKGGHRASGQVLYMPIYSNLPHREKKDYDLSALLAIHNTDLENHIKITVVDYFRTDGKLVKRFLEEERDLGPLATVIFTVPQRDQAGTGANFLVEWLSDRPVSEPLVESVMKDLTGNLGLAFLSQGRVIRESP